MFIWPTGVILESLVSCSTWRHSHDSGVALVAKRLYFHQKQEIKSCSIELMIFILWYLMCSDLSWLSLQPHTSLHPHAPARQHVPSHYHLMTEGSLIRHIFTPHYYKKSTITLITTFTKDEKICMNRFKRTQRTCRAVFRQTWISCTFTFIISKWGQNLGVVFF